MSQSLRWQPLNLIEPFVSLADVVSNGAAASGWQQGVLSLGPDDQSLQFYAWIDGNRCRSAAFSHFRSVSCLHDQLEDRLRYAAPLTPNDSNASVFPAVFCGLHHE